MDPLPPDKPILSFCDAPKLRDVHIARRYATRIQLPWHQLTKFRPMWIDVEDCLELLRHASNLVDAQLRLNSTYCYYFDYVALPNTILLPQLQSLDLSGPWRDEEVLPIALLQYLETPVLKSLTLCFMEERNGVYDISPFLSFVSQPLFQLQTLTLSSLPTTVDDLSTA
ncbi:hypothetical protein MSAN_01046600 [Mycena sanguinolenta]|uniref:Uncharacterized protein n=1 Tax=Mycena sanguinolenta TaxID=230812 RepID=A0A8H6YS86_9AGAR|nr:hypothetical protein MSAN_01046600 [Mycena sanguinolenta]